MDIPAIQEYLQKKQLKGWLLADFHGRNNIAVELLGISGIVTRRSFYFIPAVGTPTGFVHKIEEPKYAGLPGKIQTYSGYEMLESMLSETLSGVSPVAMEYSPNGRLPYIGLVDSGTIELIRSFSVDIVSSADLVAHFQAKLTPEQVTTHRTAAKNLLEIKDKAFQFVRDSLETSKSITEYDVVQFVLAQFESYGMVTSHSPICGVDANAGDPHYEPPADTSKVIERNQLLLLDLWAKLKHPTAVYGDITWMAFIGRADDIPQKYDDLFGTIVAARDRAISFLNEKYGSSKVFGSEVDDACRAVVVKAGYGDYFTHRTGHSIAISEHGPGPNIDNLETEDSRELSEGHLFSIEPGIYMDDCGFRTEIDMLITADGPEVTTLPLQEKITPLF